MRKVRMNRIKILIFILVLIILLLIILFNNRHKMNDLLGTFIKKEELPFFSYVMYDNQNEEKIKVLIKVNNEDGLEYVETPEGEKITTIGRKNVAFDYSVIKDEEYGFKIKTSNGEIKEEKLKVDDEYIQNKILKVENPTEGTGVTTLEITNYLELSDYITYYKFGENGQWKQVEGTIQKEDYFDFLQNGLANEDDAKINVYVKNENSKNSNKIIVKKEYNLNFDLAYGGILNYMGKMRLENDNYYEVEINDEVYTIHSYVYEGNQEWNSNMVFGNANDVAKSTSEYAKNMVVVKVNGDLTIGQGITVTSYGSTYGGPKGMLLYVTGNLINNGTISMTARGAYAKGQNVYLWENEDGSREYVPANGANGGAGVKAGDINKPSLGVNGVKGTGRKTGGGASGGSVYFGTSGSGAQGTSYSGGAGGGGAYNSATAENGQLYGGKGGNAMPKSSIYFSWSCGGRSWKSSEEQALETEQMAKMEVMGQEDY